MSGREGFFSHTYYIAGFGFIGKLNILVDWLIIMFGIILVWQAFVNLMQ